MECFLPGDHIRVACLGYNHHAIVVEYDEASKAQVIHYRAGTLGKHSGSEVKQEEQDVSQYELVERPEDPAKTLARARSKIGRARYNLLFNNCENFATWCVSGVGVSHQMVKHVTRVGSRAVLPTVEYMAGLAAGRLSRLGGPVIVCSSLLFKNVELIRKYMDGAISAGGARRQLSINLSTSACGMLGSATGCWAGSALGAWASSLWAWACNPAVGLVFSIVGALLGGAIAQQVGGNFVSKFVNSTFPEDASEALDRAYKTLGLTPRASNEEVSQAFKRLARIHHPDHGGSNEKMVELNVNLEIIRQAREKEDQSFWNQIKNWARDLLHFCNNPTDPVLTLAIEGAIVHRHPLKTSRHCGRWICDGCDEMFAPQASTRFRCIEGCDFDFCAVCWQRSGAHGHGLIEQDASQTAWCDQCTRHFDSKEAYFKCTQGCDFMLCSECWLCVGS